MKGGEGKRRSREGGKVERCRHDREEKGEVARGWLKNERIK